MTQSTEAAYSVTFKTPKGNLVTVRGGDADEWVVNLNAAASSGALTVIAQIEASLAGQPAPPAARPTAAAPSSPAKQADQELPPGFAGVKCGTCGAEARFEKEGISSQSGQPYKRYRCTANQLHKATFTN